MSGLRLTGRSICTACVTPLPGGCARGAPWEIAAQLGHQMSQKLTTTEIYAAYAPDYQEKATAALERLLTAVLASCATVKIKPREFAKG